MAQDHTTPSFARTVPPGDTLERAVCERCGFVVYDNPRVVVGAVVRREGRVLLCRRAIEPRKGFWTLPAGFLELKETPEAGARREAREEACADIEIDTLLAVYTIPRLSQVQLIYRARLAGPYAPGPESEAVELFERERIPWDDIAFPSVIWALDHDEAVERRGARPPFANPEGADGDLGRFAGRPRRG